jgi:hypothetical protein
VAPEYDIISQLKERGDETMNSQTKGVRVILASSWTPERFGVFPARIVIWMTDENVAWGSPFNVHMEVRGSEGLYFTGGNYDLGWQMALDTFNRRAGNLGLANFGEIFPLRGKMVVTTPRGIKEFASKSEAITFQLDYHNFISK